MGEIVKPEDCLIVAADYSPDEHGRAGARKKALALAEQLKGMGVFIKVNSLLRACGYDLIDELHDLGLRVMADLKLTDIPKTMETDGEFLVEAKPEILTVMGNSGVAGMAAVKVAMASLDSTEILAVTVLTSLDEEDCQAVYSCSTKAGVLRFARLAQAANCDGVVLSPKEVGVITKRTNELDLCINTPAIRPFWALVKGDDQERKRVTTPADAITAGAKRIIIGRPVTQADDPRGAAQRTLNEIAEALDGQDDPLAIERM